MVKLVQIPKTDYPALYGFMEETWLDTYLPIIPRGHIESLLHKYLDAGNIENFITKGYKYYYIHDNVNVGMIVYVEQANGLYLDKLYVLKQYRGKGYSTYAIGQLKNFGKDITLNVNRSNEQAIAVYKHNGFEIDKITDLSVTEGFVNNDYVMRWRAAPARELTSRQ